MVFYFVTFFALCHDLVSLTVAESEKLPPFPCLLLSTAIGLGQAPQVVHPLWLAPHSGLGILSLPF